MFILFVIKSPVLWAYGLYLIHYRRSISQTTYTIYSSPLSYLLPVLQSMIISCCNLLEANNYRPPKFISKSPQSPFFLVVSTGRWNGESLAQKKMRRVLRANKSISRKQLGTQFSLARNAWKTSVVSATKKAGWLFCRSIWMVVVKPPS